MFRFIGACSLLFLVSVSAQIDYEALCVGHTEPWGFVAVPQECRNWVACRASEFVLQGTCNETVPFNFDHNTGECNWIGCHQNAPAFECGATQFPATLHAHVSDCTKHYSCQFGIVTEVTCPAGQNFDGTACAAGAPCTSPCTGLGLTEPEMIPDPTDCTKFLACVNGELLANPACEAGQFFDNVDNACMNCFDAHCTITDPMNTNSARLQCPAPAVQ